MIHFGRGGFVDYVLSEIYWRSQQTPKFPYIGKLVENKTYDYKGPNHWWHFMYERFDKSNLSRNLVLR
jgi:hypothetical protein